MYTVSVPISMETVNETSLPRFGQLLLKMGAQRVFLCNIGEVYLDTCMLYTQPGTLSRAMAYLKELGLEVGVWVNGFGHGALLAHQTEKDVGHFTPVEDAAGRSAPVCFCPLNEPFRGRYLRGMTALAALKPDIIMIDDDMRFHMRKGYFSLGCFCQKHLAWYYDLLGEEVPRSEIEERIFTGAPNPYRQAYLHMMGKTLLDFAADLRAVVDQVDPNIRLGCSICTAMWDSSGTDVLALARTLAGATRPFARITGAPYHNVNIIPIIERSRQQCAWGKDSGVELFCEGDTYPRPRTNVPARTLELFDFAMACDGSSDGMLQYVFDYTHDLSYEEGYVRRMIRNRPVREAAAALFAGKWADGVEVYDVMHKLADWHLPETLSDNTVQWIQATPSKGLAADVLCRNSIPTAYEETGMPVLVFGENGRHIPLEKLGNGAILDVTAAELLQSRGVDVGLLGTAPGSSEEHFSACNQTVRGVGAEAKVAMETAGQAESLYSSGVASYRYENSSGQRFFVLGCRFYAPGFVANTNYLCSWARRQQLQTVIPWLCGRTLPAVLDDAPETELLVRRDENSMAVAVLNIYYDEIIDPVIRLDKAYSHLTCINCTGRLEGDRVLLDTIPPYGFAAFQVR